MTSAGRRRKAFVCFARRVPGNRAKARRGVYTLFTSATSLTEVQTGFSHFSEGSAYMFVKELHQAGHVRKFSVKKLGESGWEVRDVQDERVLRQVCYNDWHRVEVRHQMLARVPRLARLIG